MLMARFANRGQNARAKKPTGDLTRKTPHQARAKETLKAIFEATARILERRGRKALNTNYIAARAGICIGTLYQYFPNKEAILISMARALIESDSAALTNALSSSPDEPNKEPYRVVIHTLITELEKRRETRRAAIDTLIAEGLGCEQAISAEVLADIVAAKTDRLFPQRASPLSPAAVFVMTRAVNGVLRATIEEKSSLLGTPEFEDELVRMVGNYVVENP
jgi:AcrR family transcriptional regulator